MAKYPDPIFTIPKQIMEKYRDAVRAERPWYQRLFNRPLTLQEEIEASFRAKNDYFGIDKVFAAYKNLAKEIVRVADELGIE